MDGHRRYSNRSSRQFSLCLLYLKPSSIQICIVNIVGKISDFCFLLTMAGDSLLERLFSNKSKYPPDVKFITLEGPLPAHKSLLTSSSPAMKEYFFPKVGPPQKWKYNPFHG